MNDSNTRWVIKVTVIIVLVFIAMAVFMINYKNTIP